MNIVEATAQYEAWADERIGLIPADVAAKHRRMESAPFPFLRATFYRWSSLYREACPELADAPALLAVGDLHIENFGTWRDAEARLVWGINDFDEAHPLPYTIDLVRLATSALLAGQDRTLLISGRDAAAAILRGYREAIMAGDGKPFVLEEENPALRIMAMSKERDPVRFWTKLSKQKPVATPKAMQALLLRHLPDEVTKPRFLHRIAGAGSLGRPRYAVIAQSAGGLVAREAKPLLPSAWRLGLKSKREPLFYDAILKRAIRAPDPFLAIEDGWVLRRLAPHCTRIEIGELPREKDEQRLLEAMGRETANVHLGSRDALSALRRDLKRRGNGWLYVAANRMAAATIKDWKAWSAR
jgi:hypothetical protein